MKQKQKKFDAFKKHAKSLQSTINEALVLDAEERKIRKAKNRKIEVLKRVFGHLCDDKEVQKKASEEEETSKALRDAIKAVSALLKRLSR